MSKLTSMTRRQFVKRTAVAGAGVAMFSKFFVPTAKALNNTPGLLKWTQPLRGLNIPATHPLAAALTNDPNGIPVALGTPDPVFPNTRMYNLVVQEFSEVLHSGLLGATKLWGYAEVGPGALPVVRHLGGVIIAERNIASRLRITNLLPARHILPVDITIPGSTTAQNRIATHLHGGLVPWISDGGPFDWFTPGCPDYANGQSFLNGPATPTLFPNDPNHPLDNIPSLPMVPGQADYYYPNNQSTRLMWYHDHAWGITRLNAYAGIATAYFCLDSNNDTARLTANVPSYKDFIPLVWQDKKFVSGSPGDPAAVPPVLPTGTFATDPTWADVTRPDVQTPGSLWYEHTYNPKLWTLKAGLPLPDPSVIAEFFGDTILCNGTVYPKLTVDPKAYRFVLLNATNARFFNINTFVANAAAADGITLDLVSTSPTYLYPLNAAGPAITQIGCEGGYLAKEVKFTTSATTKFNPKTLTGNLIMGPAERADVVIDFSTFAGKDIIIYNDAPAPFPGGAPINDYFIGNPRNPIIPAPGYGPDTRQILRIHVNTTLPDGTVPPPQVGPFLQANMLLDPAPLAPLPTTLPATLTPLTAVPVLVPTPTVPPALPIFTRQLTLNETFDKYGRLIQMLGTLQPQPGGGFGIPLTNPVTENVTAGSTEVWQIYNTTADTHPMHFHLVNAQVLSRQPFKVTGGVPAPTGVARGPDANELGWKETIKMNPGEVTSILMKFDLPTALPFTTPKSPRPGVNGHEYVWHCHILEHEEHDMMRPLVVL